MKPGGHQEMSLPDLDRFRRGGGFYHTLKASVFVLCDGSVFNLPRVSFLKSQASPSKRFDRDDLSTKGPSSDSAGKHRGTRICVGRVR
ncbi:hypothetical protein Pan14r_40520 [Crateriforma conspicua]|uniref:Uncharacterized protein n=1 Tax=Crateriforma conspicua TaxID=2527996 RepID=A0A5C5Y7S8_9PLAN|nr:hypothetical protein Mal65_12230 [Crateriforma conspicua]TWT71736.1 hypothetical protein Pan14r_40520 [Crateriforma conspicua]